MTDTTETTAEGTAKRTIRTKRRPRRSGTQKNFLTSIDEVLEAIDGITMAELRKIPSDKILCGKMRDLTTAIASLATNAGVTLAK